MKHKYNNIKRPCLIPLCKQFKHTWRLKMGFKKFCSTYAQERKKKKVIFLSFLEGIPPPYWTSCLPEKLSSPQEVPHSLQTAWVMLPPPSCVLFQLQRKRGCCGEAPCSSLQENLRRSACGCPVTQPLSFNIFVQPNIFFEEDKTLTKCDKV